MQHARHFIPSLPVRSAHVAAAFTLVFTFVAGLGCDENAPTETRAPVTPTENIPGYEADLSVQGDPSAQAIALPVNQSIATTAPAPAFRINQTGTGPNGIFQITRAANTQPALQGLTNGRGRAGLFRTTNTANTGPALEAQTNGSGFAIQGLATGAGGGGSFQVSNASNSQPVLTATTNGTGHAGLFQITNTSSAGNVLQASTTGTGHAGVFLISNSIKDPDNPAPKRSALYAGSNGIVGGAALFEITNPNNGDANALEVRTNGFSGKALVVHGSSGSGALMVHGSSSFNGNIHVFGNVHIDGTLTKDAGSFRIDHPLDPEHKYLSHSFVESPDMMNVYNGNVALDANGRATVELPEYFEALNRDFRYQLTAIGAPGPNLYVAEGVQQNQFKIAGGRPYARVSWQVTGVRQDTYANEHRIKVEEEKPLVKEDVIARR
jgi:hypothetical protein